MKLLKSKLVTSVLLTVLLMAGAFAGCGSDKPPTTVVGFNLTQMTTDIKALNTQAVTLTTDIAAVKASISAIESGVSEESFDALAVKVDGLKANTDTLSASLTALTTKVNGLVIPADYVIDAELQQAKIALQASIDAVKASVTALTATVTGLQTSVTGMQTTIAGLPTASQLTAIQTSVTALQTSLTALTTKVNGLVIPAGEKVYIEVLDVGENTIDVVTKVAGVYTLILDVYGISPNPESVSALVSNGEIIFAMVNHDSYPVELTYSAGTATFTHDSATVTGNATTEWDDIVVDADHPASIRRNVNPVVWYDIASIDDDHTITMVDEYSGTTAANVGYIIAYTGESNRVKFTLVVVGTWLKDVVVSFNISGIDIATATVTDGAY